MLLKPFLIKVVAYAKVYIRRLPRLYLIWNIITLFIIILLFNIVWIFFKRCPSMETDDSKPYYLHVKTFPDHHFEEEDFDDEAKESIYNLLSKAVPLTVHFVWCNDDRQNFQFQNYISILAAYKFLHPFEMIFHYDNEPSLDNDGYYQFYPDLKRDIPVLLTQPLSDSALCSVDKTARSTHVAALLNQYGGIYIDLDTVICNNLSYLREKVFTVDQNGRSLMLMAKNYITLQTDGFETLISKSQTSICVPRHLYDKSLSDVSCVKVQNEIFPKYIFELDTNFGRLARWVAYGTKQLRFPIPHNSPVIPNIVHYVWLGKHEFKFFYYLSILSSIYVLKADYVYIHGNSLPYGTYWDKIKSDTRVKFITRELPVTVFGNSIGKLLSHASDYIRLDVLLRYGGIYVDWDVVWVNNFPEKLSRYDLVMCPDWPRTGSFPDVFNMGVLAASNNSIYLRYVMESFRHYLDYHWSYNAIHIPYKVYEKHPQHVFVDRHLQVICYDLKCHPVFVEGYKDNQNDVPFNWRKDTLSIHWTSPDPPEYSDEETLRSSDGQFAEIGKFILKEAHLL